MGMNDGGAGDSLAPWNIPIYSAAARAEQVYERLYKYDAHAFPKPRLAESVEEQPQGDGMAPEAPQGRDLPQRQGADGRRRPLLAALHRRPEEQGGVAHAARADRPEGLAQGLADRDRIPSQEPDRRLPGPARREGGLDRSRGQDRLRDQARRDRPLQVPQLAARRARQLHPQRPLLGARARRRPVGRLAGDPLHHRRHRARQRADRQPGRRDRVHAVRAGEGAQASTPSIQIIRAAQPQTNPFYVQMDRKPFTDNNVRLALKYAVDRNAIVSKVELGFGSIGNDLFGKGFPSYNDHLPQRQYDPERAKSLLKKAGYDTLPVQPADVERVAGDARVRDGVQGAGEGGRDPGHAGEARRGLLLLEQQVPQGVELPDELGPVVRVAGAGRDAARRRRTTRRTGTTRSGRRRSGGRSRSPTRRSGTPPTRRSRSRSGRRTATWSSRSSTRSTPRRAKLRGIVPNIASGFSNLGAFDFKDHWFAA